MSRTTSNANRARNDGLDGSINMRSFEGRARI